MRKKFLTLNHCGQPPSTIAVKDQHSTSITAMIAVMESKLVTPCPQSLLTSKNIAIGRADYRGR